MVVLNLVLCVILAILVCHILEIILFLFRVKEKSTKSSNAYKSHDNTDLNTLLIMATKTTEGLSCDDKQEEL